MHPRLFLDVFTTEARRQMAYRADFWIGAIGGLIAGIGIPYFLWKSVFDARAMGGESVTIGGLGFEEIIAYYVTVALAASIVHGPDLLTNASTDIYEGSLTRYLVYPTHYLPFKYAQHLGLMLPNFLQVVLFGCLFLTLLTVPESLSLNLVSLLRAALSVALANLLYFLLCFVIQLVSFWADNVWSLLVLFRWVAALLGGFMLPLALYPAWAQELLPLTPFPSLYAIPVGTLLGTVSPAEWARSAGVALAWCVVLVGVIRLVWARGSLKYTGVGI